uniref:Lipid droplet-associated hydrolase n=1 Tax=Bos mutus grunniens TaxID=30521 RepID=A0A8C0AGD6_BOSMU
MDSEIKEEIPVHEEFILCCGVETQVLKCGPWTDLINNQSGTRPKLLIFIIPGNPGFSAMYVPFAKALYSATKRRFPVWIISHAGHALAPRGKKILKSSEVNAAYLGSQEMREVVKRDDETIKEHLPKLIFYYGATDSWCPKEYYDDMKKDFPEGDIRLCEKKIPHAFVISFFQEMADMVADWLKDDLSKM